VREDTLMGEPAYVPSRIFSRVSAEVGRSVPVSVIVPLPEVIVHAVA